MATPPLTPPCLGLHCTMPRRDRLLALLAVLAWTVLLGLLFCVQYQTNRQSTQAMMLQAARGIFQQIVITREWNAGHGGVYVPVTAVTRPNPYLPETDRSLVTTDGRELTKINPAFMTRQISEVAAKSEGATLHITSRNPLRPQNAPTPWEAAALLTFANNRKEAYEIETTRTGPVFRYMAPLYVAESCLPCHRAQGYEVGQVRGGISVNLPAGQFLAAQETAIAGTAGLYAMIWLVGAAGVGLGTATILAGKTRAEAANRAKSTFMAILSHELRTPLNGVLGMLELARATTLDAEQRSLLADAQAAAETMHLQVQELLELAGLENGQGLLQNTRFAPAQPIAAAIEAARTAAVNKGIAFEFRPDPALPDILLGDGARFGRILGLVLENAVKFTATGSIAVTLTSGGLKEDRLFLVTTVADTGCGIAPERLADVFEPFSQGEDVLTRRNSGLGVGLTIARRHAEILGGTLTVESRPGCGSTFTLRAPFQTVPPEPWGRDDQPPRPAA